MKTCSTCKSPAKCKKAGKCLKPKGGKSRASKTTGSKKKPVAKRAVKKGSYYG